MIYFCVLPKTSSFLVTYPLSTILPLPTIILVLTLIHGHQVIGIGREDINNQHLAATSDNLLSVQNATNLDLDQEYLLLGHDNADQLNWTSIEAPDNGVNIQRIAREWRVQETDELGGIDFAMDAARLPAPVAGLTMYALMVDDDGDFSAGASVIE